MAWEPMSERDAEQLLAKTPQAGTLDADSFATLLEAWMVVAHRDPVSIKLAKETVLDRPVDD